MQTAGSEGPSQPLTFKITSPFADGVIDDLQALNAGYAGAEIRANAKRIRHQFVRGCG
jgi:hypothetical protein